MIDFNLVLLNAGIIFISNFILYSYYNCTTKKIPSNNDSHIITCLQNNLISTINEKVIIQKKYNDLSIYKTSLLMELRSMNKLEATLYELNKIINENSIKFTIQDFVIKQLNYRIDTYNKDKKLLEEQLDIHNNTIVSYRNESEEIKQLLSFQNNMIIKMNDALQTEPIKVESGPISSEVVVNIPDNKNQDIDSCNMNELKDYYIVL